MSFSARGECIAVGVKAHVLYSRMLKDEECLALFHCDSVGEIADQLRTSEGYSPHLETLPPRELHRQDLEAALKGSLLAEATSFLLHFSGNRDLFFRKWVALYEAENLKNIFRSLLNRNTDKERLRQRLYLIPGTALSYEKILLARNFSEIAETLKETQYYKILSEPLKRLTTSEDTTLFSLEMALDNFVEAALHKAMKLLDSTQQQALMPFFGARVDLLNLYTIYRSLKFFKMPAEEILNRLIQARYRVQLPQLKSLARASDAESMAEMIAELAPRYAEVFSGDTKTANPQLLIERNINRFLYLQALKIYRKGAPNFHTAIGCFLLLEFEIKDLIKIIENVRYGYERRDAVAYLIRPIFTGGDIPWQ